MRALGMPIGAGAPVAGGPQLSPRIRICVRWVSRSEQGRPWLVAPSEPEDKDPPALSRPIGAGAPVAGGPQVSPKIRIRLRWVSRSEQGRPWLVAPN